jgi:inhibitor of cysteine peptidase
MARLTDAERVRRAMHTRTGAAALALALAVTLLWGCSLPPVSQPGTVILDEKGNGTTVQVVKGADLDIELRSNVTTGYDWYLSGALPSQLTTLTDTYETTGEPGVVGAGGVHVFTYRAAQTGTGTLRLTYVRPWETGVAPKAVYTLTVVVK